MKRWDMFSKIQQFKAMGLKKTQVADRLEIDRKTVDRYWDKTLEQYAQMLAKASHRLRRLDSHEGLILGWLREHPDLSAAQIEDWLKERQLTVSVKERTIRSYVAELRRKYGIPKPKRYREYVAVPDPPMGMQMQIDFGTTRVRRVCSGTVKLHVFGSVLSNSRYKFGEWSDQPWNTSRFIQMLLRCFEYYGGIPREIVIDQDRLLAVSENYGDIIFTEQFEQFRQKMGFRVHVCRSGDPESKGRIEAVVKYFKRGFARNRVFSGVVNWNQLFLEWLDRTGNQKLHGTTKKIPAEVFALEKQHLLPVPSFQPLPTDSVTRMVHKDNTILYRSNRYSLPKGTFGRLGQVELLEQDGQLIVADPGTGQCLARHALASGRGILVQSDNHLRDYTEPMQKLHEQALGALGSMAHAETFLERIKQDKGRYVRDQIKLILQVQEAHSMEIVQQALTFCHENQLYSAVDLRDVAQFLASASPEEAAEGRSGGLPANLRIAAATRDIDVYNHVLKAGERG